MAFEVLDGFDGFSIGACRNSNVGVELFDFQEHEDLVVWAFAVELDLGVLVGCAQGFDGGEAGEDDFVVEVELFAQGLGPELAVPVGHVVEGVAVGHHDMVGFAFAGAHFDQEQREHRGGVLVEVFIAAPRVHRGGAVEHGFDVNARSGGGEEAYGGEG